MNYELVSATNDDVNTLIYYKLKTIFEYGEGNEEEVLRIKKYVREHIPKQLQDYKIICINGEQAGCLCVTKQDDGVLIDEVYLEDFVRGRGIGTDIIKRIILENEEVYLWVYKENERAVALYESLGFKVQNETETRYYMRYSRNKRSLN